MFLYYVFTENRKGTVLGKPRIEYSDGVFGSGKTHTKKDFFVLLLKAEREGGPGGGSELRGNVSSLSVSYFCRVYFRKFFPLVKKKYFFLSGFIGGM